MCAVSAGHFESVGASSLLSERQKSPAACGSVGGYRPVLQLGLSGRIESPMRGILERGKRIRENEGETVIGSETTASHKASPSARILNRVGVIQV